MTDENFLKSLNDDERFWWNKMIAKHGSVKAVREVMSSYSERRQTIGGFTNPDVLKKAQETRAKNRK